MGKKDQTIYSNNVEKAVLDQGWREGLGSCEKKKRSSIKSSIGSFLKCECTSTVLSVVLHVLTTGLTDMT